MKMKHVFKISIALFLLTITTGSFAQQFGIRAGFKLSNWSIKMEDEVVDDFEMNPGFHFGGFMDIPIGRVFSVEADLLFSKKGTKAVFEESYMGESYKSVYKMNLFYLDIPVLAKVTFDVSKIQLYAATGPYLGIGLFGNEVTMITYDGETETEREALEWGKENGLLRRLDYGIKFGAGVVINSFIVGLTYDLGLKNISTVPEDVKIQNRVFSITLGFTF